jgi:3-isopropylmalate dehydratase small subunit
MSSDTARDIFKKHNAFKDEKAKGKCWKDIHVTALVNAGVDAFVAESIYKENSKNKDALKIAVLDRITALNKSGNPDTGGKVTFTAEQVVGNEINPEISAEVDAMIEDRLLKTVPVSEDSDDF